MSRPRDSTQMTRMQSHKCKAPCRLDSCVSSMLCPIAGVEPSPYTTYRSSQLCTSQHPASRVSRTDLSSPLPSATTTAAMQAINVFITRHLTITRLAHLYCTHYYSHTGVYRVLRPRRVTSASHTPICYTSNFATIPSCITSAS